MKRVVITITEDDEIQVLTDEACEVYVLLPYDEFAFLKAGTEHVVDKSKVSEALEGRARAFDDEEWNAVTAQN